MIFKIKDNKVKEIIKLFSNNIINNYNNYKYNNKFN